MELYIYNNAFNRLGVIDQISAFIWTRRFWSCGEFSLLIPATERHAELIEDGRWVSRRDCDEVGQIRYHTIVTDQNGLEQIEVRGKFLTHWIGNRLILPAIDMTAGTDEILRAIVLGNLVAPADPRRRYPDLTLDAASLGLDAVSYASGDLDNALDACEARAKLAKIGFKIATDLRAHEHRFVVYKGVDHTSGQTANSICIFSPDFENVLTQEYISSAENVATAVYVSGAPALDEPVKWVEVSDDTRAGLDRVEFAYQAADISERYTVDGVEHMRPEAEFLRMLRSRGEQVLGDKSERVGFTSLINPNSRYVFGRDFDVGDRVTCVNQKWRIRIDVRITEVEESFESDRHDIRVTFGESAPTLSDMIRWR